jgi:DNA-binding NtrC family response regulator
MTGGKPAVFIADSDASSRESLVEWFEDAGYAVGSARDSQGTLSALSENTWDFVLVDSDMEPVGGKDLLQRIQQFDPDIFSIVLTEQSTVALTTPALETTAFDYAAKPVNPEDLTRIVLRALERRRLLRENLSLRTQLESLDTDEALVGDSDGMNAVRELVRAAARTDTSVLVQGEPGTGKELVARSIHMQSARRYSPLVPVNCAALPESFLGSELFGHERDSYPGTYNRHRGKVELAKGGTLFLDEVGTIDARAQADLKRVLDARQFSRLGGNQVISVDFRLISAVTQNLEVLVTEGRFRKDLYQSIHGLAIVVPPLRARRRDILLCARHFLERYARQLQKPVTDISHEAADLLLEYPWPGNVRELKNAMERAVLVSRGAELRAEDLPLNLGGGHRASEGDSLSAVEKVHIIDMLEREGWNITRTAKTLYIDRVTLYNKIKKYQLKKQGNQKQGH